MKKRYRYILFDINGTLLNYWETKINSYHYTFSEICKRYNKNYSDRYISAFNKIEKDLNEKGVDQKIASIRRFEIFLLQEFNEGSKSIAAFYRNMYNEFINRNISVYSDVVPVLSKIKGSDITMCIISNGPFENQKLRLKQAGILSYFDKLFFSQVIGNRKPEADFYNYVFNSLSIKNSDAIVVGDSLKEDYLGAKSYGVDALLLDRKNVNINTSINSNKINSLSEIDNFVEFYSRVRNEPNASAG